MRWARRALMAAVVAFDGPAAASWCRWTGGPASMPLLVCSLLVASLPISRRSLLAVAGSTGIRPPLQPVSPWLGPAEATLAGSSVFWVRPGSQPSSPSLVKYEPQMALDVLSAAPSRGGALFVGEHHDSASDHVLQARDTS
eukprot:CAMPEP_0202755098 /NCGR_PEP_ID=MMETSP1388-20130828/14769_1 /ASSEMBLY_ACC=CAM_ASM_000864 /TAXON_ID=37098 /ORGANISM="Isochrysis sp, Strain CCMP1244" /LENGTH=140 /DNA_ID=CAMNT_0049422893 /DNA_START=331 /DNA_END=753 /DNA_ORIENTATION=-